MPSHERNSFKGKHGWQRLYNACRYSFDGFRAAWQDEEAFRQILLLNAIGQPLALLLGKSWEETLLLMLVLLISLIVELLNSALENTVDRVSLEQHPLAKKAKDMGSAAQMLSQICIALVWGSWLARRCFF